MTGYFWLKKIKDMEIDEDLLSIINETYIEEEFNDDGNGIIG
jgi:hypothetical protein